MTNRPILRQPNPGPQTLALTRTEREILYGGARGGGKTDAGIYRITRRVDNPGLRVLVLRETYEDLVDRVDRAINAYKEFGAKKSGIPVSIVFPSGATIRTGHLKGQSYDKYKGHEYQKMIIEELTQIPGEDSYEKILGSLRSTVDGLKPQIFLTTNPDGVGRLRVKRRFYDVAQPGERYIDEFGNTRVFIPAKVQDNQILIQKDPGYLKGLEGIKDDQLRKAWLEGDRDAYDIRGGIYTAQLNQARKESRFCRLPYEKNVDVYTAWDIGISDYTSIIFFQIIGKEIRLIDSYCNEGEDVTHYAKVLREKEYTYAIHFLPHDAAHREKGSGKTYQNYALEAGIKNIQIVPKTNDKRADINKTRQVFASCWFDREKCKTLLEHLEIYRKEFDEKHQVFRDEPFHGPESHYADAFRYLCITCQKLGIIKPVSETRQEPSLLTRQKNETKGTNLSARRGIIPKLGG